MSSTIARLQSSFALDQLESLYQLSVLVLSFAQAGGTVNPGILHLKQGDHLKPIRFHLFEVADKKKIPTNLTEAVSVKLLYWRNSRAQQVARSLIVENPSDGILFYEWTKADTSTPGKYFAEIKVTFSSERIQTYPEQGYFEFTIV
nr:BppU family phage baseplate upper protein [Leptolyngbya sp. FACHB-36]